MVSRRLVSFSRRATTSTIQIMKTTRSAPNSIMNIARGSVRFVGNLYENELGCY